MKFDGNLVDEAGTAVIAKILANNDKMNHFEIHLSDIDTNEVGTQSMMSALSQQKNLISLSLNIALINITQQTYITLGDQLKGLVELQSLQLVSIDKQFYTYNNMISIGTLYKSLANMTRLKTLKI